MSLENRLVALFEEGNPVPDIDALQPESLDAAAYLATLETRSSEMTKTEERVIDELEPRRRRPLTIAVAAAAVLIVAVGVGWLLSQNRDQVATTTTISQSQFESIEGWISDGPPFDGGTIQPAGQYRTEVFGEPFAFEVGDDWWSFRAEEPTDFGVTDSAIDLHFTILDQPSVEDAIAWYQSLDGPTVEVIGDTAVGGALGTELEVIGGTPTVSLADSGIPYPANSGEAVRVHVVAVADSVVAALQVAGAGPDSAPLTDEEQQAVARAFFDQVIWLNHGKP